MYTLSLYPPPLLCYASLPNCFYSYGSQISRYPIVPLLALPVRQLRRERYTVRQPPTAVEEPTAARVCLATSYSKRAYRRNGSRYHLPGVWLYGWCSEGLSGSRRRKDRVTREVLNKLE